MRIDLRAFKKPCPCGREHPLAVRDIRIEAGALASLPGLLAENGWEAPCIVCDENTWAAAGIRIAALLPHAAAARLSPRGLHADERGVEAARALLPGRTDALLAVGGGTLHDITRYLANERGIPFVSVPTAASVDGFVSTVAAMTWQGCKKTLPAVAPLYVVADSDVVAAAPKRLNASGFGDLLGKYTALADWEIARLVTGEYFCPAVAALMRRAVGEACEQLDAIAAGGREGCEKLLYGLLLSGLAMQMVGNSRPASGAEHHISHLWEMEVLNGPLDALHGEKVGVGLALCAEAYRAFADSLGGGTLRPGARPDTEGDIRRIFTNPGTAALVLEENRPDPLDGVTARQVLAQRDGILAAIGAIPAPDALRAMLRRAGAPATVGEIGLPAEIVPDTLRYSPYVRARLTLMRLSRLFAR